MEISKHIIAEAKKILQGGGVLPCQITSAPHFYVAESSDKSIRAFGVVEHEDKQYKVGTKR